MDGGQQLCSICQSKIELTGQTLLKPRCGHTFHAECLLNWMKQQKTDECPVCQIDVGSMKIYKKSGKGIYQWTNQPDKEITIKIHLDGLRWEKRCVCIICKRRPREIFHRYQTTDCKSCFSKIHRMCAEKEVEEEKENGNRRTVRSLVNYKCVRCRKIDFKTSICFICYKDDQVNKTQISTTMSKKARWMAKKIKMQCSECSAWCHVGCHRTKMIMNNGNWHCNWCVFNKMFNNFMSLDRVDRSKFGNRETNWLKRRIDPMFPWQFIGEATEIFNSSTGLSDSEIGSKLLTSLANLYTPITRVIKRVTVTAPKVKDFEWGRCSEPKKMDLLHLIEGEIVKINIEVGHEYDQNLQSAIL